jgi:hypothetical protein
MRNNALLVESRCASVLQLTQSDKLKELKLEARHLSKCWPKVQIIDIPESITKEALMDDLSRQNFSEAVPENFIGKMFKYGRKQQNTPGDHASNNTTSWVVELHPAARQQLIKVHLLKITHSPGFSSGHKVFQLPETWAHLQTLHLT